MKHTSAIQPRKETVGRSCNGKDPTLMMMVVEVEDLVIRGGEGKRRRFAEGRGRRDGWA